MKTRPLPRTRLNRLWISCCEDPYSPDWFELTEHGEVVVKPRPTNRHQGIIGKISNQITVRLGGWTIHRLAVMTEYAGIRSVDIAWFPTGASVDQVLEATSADCPRLIFEVLEPTDRPDETLYRMRAFLDSGAEEIVLVYTNGDVVFHRVDGKFDTSIFPFTLNLDFLRPRSQNLDV